MTFNRRIKIIAHPGGGYDRAVACNVGDLKTLSSFLRYSACQGAGGDWVVVDQDRDHQAVIHCCDAEGAAAIAALMNGDLDVLASASTRALAVCHGAIGGALRLPKPSARPFVGCVPFVQL